MNADDRCPYCNKYIGYLGHEYMEKHKAKCARKLNPPRYSERKRGRPSKKEYDTKGV